MVPLQIYLPDSFKLESLDIALLLLLIDVFS